MINIDINLLLIFTTISCSYNMWINYECVCLFVQVVYMYGNTHTAHALRRARLEMFTQTTGDRPSNDTSFLHIIFNQSHLRIFFISLLYVIITNRKGYRTVSPICRALDCESSEPGSIPGAVHFRCDLSFCHYHCTTDLVHTEVTSNSLRNLRHLVW